VRVCSCTAALVLVLSASAAAEVQLKPFIGVTFGGETTFVDSDGVAGDAKFAIGITGTWLGEFVGFEGDVGHTSGFFTGGHLISDSGVTTFTGNFVLAVPRRLARYTLRPYVIAGAGVVHTHIEYGPVGVLPTVASSLAVIDIGGGATGFLKERVGINFDVRHFGSVGGSDRMEANAFGPDQISFWRATFGVVIR
jgi:Outer membrane protein beta-barrel domain